MHVMLVGPYPENPDFPRGGVEASVAGLGQALGRLPGVNVTVLALGGHPGYQSSVLKSDTCDIQVLATRAPRRRSLEAVAVLRSVGGRAWRAADVVHVHGTGTAQLLAIVLTRFSRRQRAVWTLHGITELETLQVFRKSGGLANLLRYWLYRSLERGLIRLASHIIVDTEYVARHVRGRRRDGIYVIPQGMSIRMKGTRRILPEPEFLSVGVLSPRKGHDLLIEALSIVRAKVPGVHLTIAGAATHSGFDKVLRDMIVASDLQSAVSLHADAPREDICEMMLRSSVFVLHSREESQGIAICEAMAAGLPVVATSVGGIPDVVRHGVEGYLVQPGNPSEFAEAMLQMLQVPDAFSDMSENAMSRSRVYAWESLVLKVVGIYKSGPR